MSNEEITQLYERLGILGENLLAKIEKTGDPISFGYNKNGKNKRYIVSITVKNIEQSKARVSIKVYEDAKKFIFQDLRLVIESSLDITLQHSNNQSMHMAVKKFLYSLSDGLQLKIFNSREPFTLSYRDKGEEIQIEAVATKNQNEKIQWDIF